MNQEKKKSFVDEDWTGFTHNQIKSMIKRESRRDELEKLHDACKDGNHIWEEEKLTFCSVCGRLKEEKE